MSKDNKSPRFQLLRDAAVLQLKLLVDGFRDALLIPISLLAAVLGIIRGGADADREFQRVIKLGRRSERWINLFGHQPPLGRHHPTGSMDLLLDQVETTVMEQYRKGRTTEEARAAIEAAMDAVPEDSGQSKTGEKQSEQSPQ